MSNDVDNFTGVKIALLLGSELLIIQRDDIPGLSFAGLWDFPGGGRDAGETPFECIAREVDEELGIRLLPEIIIWQRTFPSMLEPGMIAYFMVARISQSDVDNVRFGDEGQGWKLMPVDQFMQLEDAVPYLKPRMQAYLDDTRQAAPHA
ncbi:MAG TPA: NUDIX hydrolase [Candidatus Saccharimonadales bacterium]|jgi:8-oxo-dGTP diphosphatase